MGYSVYVTFTKKEAPRIERFIDELENSGAYGTESEHGPFGAHVRGPLIGDLSYVEAGDKNSGRHVGCDYGDHWMAHTIVNRIAALMGRSHYIYDGVEKIPVKPDERALLGGSMAGKLTYDLHLACARNFGTQVMTPEEFAEEVRGLREFEEGYVASLNRAADIIDAAWNKTIKPTKRKKP